MRKTYFTSIILFIFILSLPSGLNAQARKPEKILQTAKQLIRDNKTDAALKLYQDGIEQAQTERDLLYEGTFYLEAADLLLLLNQVDSLESYYGKAARIFDKLQMKPENIRAQTGMLELARRTNPTSTMDKYLELLKQAREINDRDVYYNVLDKIILVNNGMENYPEAFAQLHECITYYKQKKDTLLLAMKYRELGALFFTHHTGRNGPAWEKDSCIYYHIKAIELFNHLKSYRNLVLAYQRLSWLYYYSDVKMAWKYALIADSIDRKYNIQSAQLPNIMSFSLHKMGRTREAIAMSKESLQRGMKARQLFVGIQAADQLYECYKALKEPDSALYYMELSAMINDSIRSQRQYKEAARMQAKLEFERESFQKELLQQEEVKRQKLIKTFSLIGVGLLLIIVFLVYRAYTHSRKNEKEIARQNDEKSLLLKEIHHRVKNNLTIVSGILDLQQREINDEKLLTIFRDARSRITSMALVHKYLYEQDNVANINTQQYFEALFNSLHSSYKSTNKNVRGIIHCQEVKMNIDTLIPLALITNELLTNSFKYAFEGKDGGTIELKLLKEGGHYCFEYSDDGVGIDETKKTTEGLGTKLIKGLAQQLGGQVQQVKQKGGWKFSLEFAGIHPTDEA